jgi:hypothetical protein
MDFSGKDNYGKPKQEYVDRIAAMTDAELEKETERKIWLSAYAGNNPRSDYHWHSDACYVECEKRDPKMYEACFEAAKASM